ncbi:MAG: HEAT repeat domain-containing protein, partial [Planctomycetota bacterium]
KNFILRKKISIKDKKLFLEELKPEDWPKMLDEVIMDNLVRLDQSTVQMVNQAAVMGRQIDLKVLKEVTNRNEGETLDIVDKAKHARLIKETDPAKTDNFTFINQRIQEIAYQSIDEETKQELHQQVGQATETVYQDNLEAELPSLVYHYSKAGNETKAAEHGYRLEEVAGKLFRSAEATEYFEHGRMIVRSKIKEAITPLPENHNPTLREVYRGLSAAAKNMRLYPEGSQLISFAFGSLLQSLNTIFKQIDKFTISEIKNLLHINTIAAESKAFGSAVNELYQIFREHYIKSCTFQRGVNEKEIELFLRNLDNNPEKGFSESGYWNKYLEEKQIVNIGIAQRAFVVSQSKITSRLSQAEKEKLVDDQSTVNRIKEMLRYFCAAVENIKLYPAGSQITTNAVNQVNKITTELFQKTNIINFSEVEDILVMNGSHINPKIFGLAANTLAKIIQNYGFKSMTILKNTNQAELEKFLTILSNPPKEGKLDINEWNDLVKKNGINNIILGSVVYKSADEQKGAGRKGLGGIPYFGGASSGVGLAGNGGQPGGPMTDESFETPSGGTTTGGFFQPTRPKAVRPNDEIIMLKVTRFLKDLPDRLLTPEFSTILEKLPNPETQIKLIDKFLENFKSQRPEMRTKTGPFYLELLNKTQSPLLKKTLIAQVTPVLLQNLKVEKEPAAYDHLLEITRQHFLAHLQEDDYQSVKNLVWTVAKYRRTDETFTPELQQKTKQALSKLMAEEVFSKLIEGLKSTDAKIQQTAVNIFSGFGPMTTPVLINLLKESEELHLREVSASLLREFGAEVIPLVVNELSQLTEAKQINHFLGIIDIINPPELNEILMHYIKHPNAEIKTAALTTIKRLDQERALKILIPLLNDKNSVASAMAAVALGGLGYPESAPHLINLLQKTTKKRLQKECCISLGKICDPQAVPTLAYILEKKRFLGI